MTRTLLPLVLAGCIGSVSAPEGEPVAPDPSMPIPPAPEGTPRDEHASADASVRIARTDRHGSYLTDADARPLYMYVADTGGAQRSACLADCARDFPPFDVLEPVVESGIDAAEVARFHRQDGLWQTTYKGYPLYLRASEAERSEVTADGFAGRWFLAKDYLTFLALPMNFEPAGDAPAEGAPSTFLVDGYGRTLYVCLDDRPAGADAPPQTSCTGTCIGTRPPLSTGATTRTTVLPASVDARELRAFQRPDGAQQLTYRGWPLYYFAGDAHSGDTIGHNQRAWRAIDPRRFPGSLTSTGRVLARESAHASR